MSPLLSSTKRISKGLVGIFIFKIFISNILIFILANYIKNFNRYLNTKSHKSRIKMEKLLNIEDA
jgi:hypothetical protein